MNETDNMHIASTSYLAVIFKNLLWLLVFLFTPVINWLIAVMPGWKELLENFKLMGGSLIVVLVIIKLLLEIKKINKK